MDENVVVVDDDKDRWWSAAPPWSTAAAVVGVGDIVLLCLFSIVDTLIELC